MTRLAWITCALALRWASATNDQRTFERLERVEAELWDLTHPNPPRGGKP